MNYLYVIRIVAVVISLMTMQIACIRHVSTNVPTTPVQEDPVITSLTVAFTGLPITAAIWNSYVDSYYKDKQITKAEGQEFLKWSKNVDAISKVAKAELKSDHPREVKILAVAKIMNDYQKPALLTTMSPKMKAAYRAITAGVDAVFAELHSATQ